MGRRRTEERFRDTRFPSKPLTSQIPDGARSVFLAHALFVVDDNACPKSESGPASGRRDVPPRDILGTSYGILAELLEVPLGTVMSRLYNARRHLRNAVEGLK